MEAIDPRTADTTAALAAPPPPVSPERELLWLFAKNAEGSLSANFSLREFHCHCRGRGCSTTLVHPKLVESLQTLRERLARPLILTSGYRCKAYNRMVGGVRRSYHLRGMAADVLCPDGEGMDELARAASDIPAVGAIGSYPSRRVLHLDVRRRAPGSPPIEWVG